MLAFAALLAGPAAAQDQQGLTEQQRINEHFGDDKLPRAILYENGSLQGLDISRAESEAYRFTLKQVRFFGMTIYDANDTRPLIADLVGAEVSLADIRDLAKVVEDKYDTNGNTPAEVVLDRMPSADGIITLDVLENTIAANGPTRGRGS